MIRNERNIVFIGMMGTFKTAVSRLVARYTGWPLYDTDEMFEREYGPISEYFDNSGEAAFREAEAGIVRRVARLSPSVISTGGGVVLRADNMNALRESGRIVLLTASPDAIYARVSGGNGRPLLKGDTMSNIVRISAERKAAYERYADYTVDNTFSTPEGCADEVLTALGMKRA